jgi:hypothetical protein
MPTRDKSGADLEELVSRMQHLKAEHGPILSQIQEDQGMSPRVRSVLLEHLGQEEAELMAEIAQLSPSKAAEFRAGTPRPAPSAAPGHLTVGSLREGPRPARAASAPSSLPKAPTRGAGPKGMSVGSLRRR